MRIYLIGFMGTGKTTLGSRVAEELNVPFLDTDTMIETEIGKTISEIFSLNGEDEFRLLEKHILKNTIDYEKAIIATGGGLPVYHNNMQWLNEHGITIYLQWPEEILIASLMHHRSIRPLLSELTEEEAIRKAMPLLEERIPVYEQSSITIEMQGDVEMDTRLLAKACRYVF